MDKEELKRAVSAGVSSLASSLSTLGWISSGPGALLGFRFKRSFLTPVSVTTMGSMVGAWGGGVEGMPVLSSNSSAVYSAGGLKADLNWQLSASAFSMGERTSFPFTLSGDTPVSSVFFILLASK